jgi:hypothetical protein
MPCADGIYDIPLTDNLSAEPLISGEVIADNKPKA